MYIVLSYSFDLVCSFRLQRYKYKSGLTNIKPHLTLKYAQF